MRYFLLYIFLILDTASGFAQKASSQIFDVADVKEVFISANEVFKINIKTTNTNQIAISSMAGGEYYNDIFLNVDKLKNQLIFTTQYPQNLTEGYDKLSAHKIFSMELTVELPEDLRVYIESNTASVTGSGKYEFLEIELKSGFCNLKDLSGDVLVNTYNGAITIETADAVVNASSRNGKVELPVNMKGNNRIQLQTINGNIRVRKN